MICTLGKISRYFNWARFFQMQRRTGLYLNLRFLNVLRLLRRNNILIMNQSIEICRTYRNPESNMIKTVGQQ